VIIFHNFISVCKSFLKKKPLLVRSGNIKNKDLYDRFTNHFQQIIELLEACDLVEMDNTEIIVHE